MNRLGGHRRKAFRSVGGGSSLLTGLVSWWDLTANGNDSHGSNNMSSAGSPAFGTVGGYDCVTTSATDRLYNASPSGIPTLAFSGAIWLYPTSISVNNGTVVKFGDGTSTAAVNWVIEQNNDDNQLRISNASAWIDASLNNQSVINTWTMIIFTYDDSTGEINVYKDNDAFTANASTGGSYITSSSYGLGIGGDGDGSGSGAEFVGGIRSCGIWNRVITAGERATLWNSGVPLVYSSL